MTNRLLHSIPDRPCRHLHAVACVLVLAASWPASAQHVPTDVVATPASPPEVVLHPGSDERVASENAIRAVRVIAETARELTLEVDYSYAGDHGTSVFIGAYASEGGVAVPGTGYRPGPVVPGNQNTRVVLVAAADAPATFPSDAILLQMYVGEGDPFVSQTVAFRKTWSVPTAALPIQLQLVGPSPQPAPQQAPPDASRIVERRIADDGAVELVYGDGTIKRLYSGGYTIIFPDGRRQTASFMSAQPPTAPDPPPDDALYPWLQNESDWLLDMIRVLVGNNTASVNNYLAKEPADASLLRRIWLRQRAIEKVMTP